MGTCKETEKDESTLATGLLQCSNFLLMLLLVFLVIIHHHAYKFTKYFYQNNVTVKLDPTISTNICRFEVGNLTG